MSERKVLTKYYPPDFDPSQLGRSRGPKKGVLPTIRLETPFSMRCTRCGSFIPKSRKFNARKEIPKDDKYLGIIQRFRFYIRCPDCHGEISFKTDPKNMDYEMESGAQRNFEVWREGHVEETDEERLRRFEAEGAEDVEVDVMADLEAKMAEAQREMAVADALDEIRAANARNQVVAEAGAAEGPKRDPEEEERERQEREDAEAARRAFRAAGGKAKAPSALVDGYGSDSDSDDGAENVESAAPAVPAPPPVAVPEFKRVAKIKKDFKSALGIKKKAA